MQFQKILEDLDMKKNMLLDLFGSIFRTTKADIMWIDNDFFIFVRYVPNFISISSCWDHCTSTGTYWVPFASVGTCWVLSASKGTCWVLFASVSTCWILSASAIPSVFGFY